MRFNYRDGALVIECSLDGYNERSAPSETRWRTCAAFTDRNTGYTATMYGQWVNREDAEQQLKILDRIFATN